MPETIKTHKVLVSLIEKSEKARPDALVITGMYILRPEEIELLFSKGFFDGNVLSGKTIEALLGGVYRLRSFDRIKAYTMSQYPEDAGAADSVSIMRALRAGPSLMSTDKIDPTKEYQIALRVEEARKFTLPYAQSFPVPHHGP